MPYISTDSILSAYNQLTSIEIDEPNIFFTFLILKSTGYNELEYKETDLIKKGFSSAFNLSSLFSSRERIPEKYNFINPLSMKQWKTAPVSEGLQKWVNNRIKNNIIGGATTWRPLILLDKDQNVKFSFDYIQEIKKIIGINNKINLLAIAVWSNRFTYFNIKTTRREIIKKFISDYNLTKSEIAEFFIGNDAFEIEYSDEMHDTGRIRNLLGSPNEMAWREENMSDRVYRGIENTDLVFNTEYIERWAPSVNEIINILRKNKQIILRGPPGTSKSYISNEVSKLYDVTIHIQFHPQYTYQQFVGGYIVEKSEVVYRKGVILNLLDIIDDKKQYLLVVDELNRANVSQVFGEILQCLDRDQQVGIIVDGGMENVRIPDNVHIIATMNTTDRTLGTVDYAIKRRFMNIYCPPDPTILMDLCPSSGFISLHDLMKKINERLYDVLKDKELCIGHALFLDRSVFSDGKFNWDFETFRFLFYHKIYPLIEDYCSGDMDMMAEVIGSNLIGFLKKDKFEEALKEYIRC